MSPGIVPSKNKGPKACTTCAKAKARCVPGPEGSLKCDRCHRLDKTCMSQTPAPPRPRKSPKLSKIAALEKRLEELSSHVRHDSSSRSPTPSPEAETEPTSELCSKTDSSWDFNHIFPLKQSSDSQTPHPPASEPGKRRPWDSWWPTPHEAELLLAGYRNIHACLFPFVRVPEHLTALEVRENRPFMWKAIMMVGCFLDGARQVKLGEELLAEIGRAAVVDGLKSLDLLHGLQMVFTANKRPDVLMNTSSLETCCKALEANMQYPSDEYLVKLVRIQQLAQSISLTMTVENIGQHAMKLPLTMVVRSFQDQLDQYRNSLGPRFSGNDNLKSHIHVAEVLLYEIALSDQHSTASYMPLTDRLQLLWGCLRSLKSFFDLRFSHRELERPRFLCMSASDFVYTIITGIKLMTLQLPGWNLASIHNELDMTEVMDQQVRDLVVIVARRKQGNMLGTATPLGVPAPQPPEDPFERLLRQLKTLRDLVKVELKRLVAGTANPQVIEFSQDILMGDFSSDFWQGSTQGFNVWNIVGDPGVLDESLQ
ncbi:hypothetical protein Neosp_000423 [[Neocosmospora] mangrovei]